MEGLKIGLALGFRPSCFVPGAFHQEDGKGAQVEEEDDNGGLTGATNYSYDPTGRLLTISQGNQTGSFTYQKAWTPIKPG